MYVTVTDNFENNGGNFVNAFKWRFDENQTVRLLQKKIPETVEK